MISSFDEFSRFENGEHPRDDLLHRARIIDNREIEGDGEGSGGGGEGEGEGGRYTQ